MLIGAMIAGLAVFVGGAAGSTHTGQVRRMGPNLVVNGGFEKGHSGWGGSLEIVEEPVYSKQHAARLDNSPNKRTLSIVKPYVPIKGGVHYRFSAAFLRTNGHGYVYVHCNWYAERGERLMSSPVWNAGRAGPVTLCTGEGTGSWQVMSGDICCSRRDVGGLQLVIFIRGGDDIVYVDDVSIQRVQYPQAPDWALSEAVVFPGRPSDRGMTVETAGRDGDVFTVTTTGANYLLDTKENELECRQRIGTGRKVATVNFAELPGDMEIGRRDRDVCVVMGDDVAFGFQGDSLVTIATNRTLQMSVVSHIGAEWFRRQDPHLLAIDERGGFCVMPRARRRLSSPGSSISSLRGETEAAGWRADYKIGAREMVGLAVFPGKHFDWKKSFNRRIVNTYDCPPADALREYRKHADVLFIFSGIYDEHPGGHSHAPYNIADVQKLRSTIELAHGLGMEVIIYRHPKSYDWADLSLDYFLEDIRVFRETYGFDGWYFDGYPGWSSWFDAYRCMRTIRERVGDGTIYVHCTLNPPIRMTELYCPFIDAYADFLLRGEAQIIDGPADPYLRYVINTQHISNSIATLKGNEMRKKAGSEKNASLRLQLKTMLKLNGRCRWAYPGWPLNKRDKEDYIGFYFSELDDMQKQWEQTGEAPSMTWPYCVVG